MPKIKLNNIQVGYNPRQIFDPEKLNELAQSIQDKRQMVPIAVTSAKEDKEEDYKLIYGERRYRACEKIEKDKILAEIRDVDRTEMLLAKGIENLSRGDLHFLEQGAYFQKLLSDDKYKVKTQTQLAKAIGISQRDVSQKIRIYTYFYFPIHYEYKNRNISSFDAFGLTHALQLTKLHHDRLVIEKREENENVIKLEIKDLLDEVIDDDHFWAKKFNEFRDLCITKQENELEEILENSLSTSTVKKHVNGHKSSIQETVLDFVDTERNKKCTFSILDNDKARVFFNKDARVLKNDYNSNQEESFNSGTRFFNDVNLVVTSPPYFANKEYEDYEGKDPYNNAYLPLLKDIFSKVYAVMTKGGVCCINIGDVPTKLKNSRFRRGIIQDLNPIMDKIGFQLFDEIIWKKDDPWNNNPHVKFEEQQGQFRILPSFEHIFIFRKEGEYRDISDEKKSKTVNNGLNKGEWQELASGVWEIDSVSSNDDHPAEFPSELPRRLIKMYSFVNDIVLDPFCGTGKTMIEANKLNRHGIGYDLNYKELVEEKCFNN